LPDLYNKSETAAYVPALNDIWYTVLYILQFVIINKRRTTLGECTKQI